MDMVMCGGVLMRAVDAGLFAVCKVREAERLIRQGADVTVTNGRGETPLHQIFANTSVSWAKVLLRAGAKADAQEVSGQTPLSWLLQEINVRQVTRTDVAKIELLLSYGADPQLRDRRGLAPLDHLEDEEQREQVRMIIQQYLSKRAKQELEDAIPQAREEDNSQTEVAMEGGDGESGVASQRWRNASPKL